METLWQDVRYAFRMLRKNGGFTAVAVLTLALGIGANTAIFSVVNGVLLRPLPFRDSSRLYLLTERLPAFPILAPSYQNFVDWRAQNSSFEDIAAVHNLTFTMTGMGAPERLQAQMASANLFPLLGVGAIQGHTFLPEEDRAGGSPVALVSYGLWQRRFSGARDVLGKDIILDNQTYTITGVLPPGFQFLRPVDVMVPFEPWANTLPDDRSWHPGIIAVGRLKPGVSGEQARADMEIIGQRLAKQYPVYDTDVSINVFEMHDQLVQNVRPALLVLLGAVGLVLLIACVNVANLLLARASSRQREIAIRTAIGAARMRIVRQLLTESITLSCAGAVFGLLLAWVTMAPLLRLAAANVPNVGPIGLDGRVLLFTLGLALFAGVIFGLAPALQTAKLDLRAMLNEATRGSTGGVRHQRVRNVLVVTEVALAILLLIGAGLLLRSFERLQNVQPGFEPENLLVADVPLSPQAYPQSPERMAFFDRLLERARALPGVRSAGGAVALPVSGTAGVLHFNIEGRAPKSPRDFIVIGYRPVSPGYLQTLGVPLAQGRLLTDADTERGPFVVVVNQAMVRRYFPDGSAMGKHVQIGATPTNQIPFMEIVGIVGDVKQSLATDPQAEMYLPIRQADAMLPIFSLSIVLRTQGDPRTEISSLRSAIHDLDPNQPVEKIRTMQENISSSVTEPRFRTVLLGIFAMSALLLSVIGLYGLMAYSVSQRVHEIGIRMTLGAQKRDVMWMIVGQGMLLTLLGVGIGSAAAVLLTKLLVRFLYGVSATDPVTFAAVSLVLLVVALLACYLPARRATKVDPMIALRYE